MPHADTLQPPRQPTRFVQTPARNVKDGATSMTSACVTSNAPATSDVRGANSVASGDERPPLAEDHPPVASHANGLITVIGRDGCFKRLAPGFPCTFGYTEAELLDQPFISLLHADDRAATSTALEKLSQGEPTLGLENRFRCKDGSHRRLAWTAMPTPEGLLYAVARQVTEHSQTEEAPAGALAHEQATNLAHKEHLLASVCHDVQQPLTVILAQTELLQRQLARDGTLPTEQIGMRLAHIFAAATRMRDMTHDLLDASVQQSGHALALLLARTELVALARQVVGEQRLASDLHQFLFEAAVPTLEATVDETRVHRVLVNLLSNAVKYSPDGGAVQVTVKANRWA